MNNNPKKILFDAVQQLREITTDQLHITKIDDEDGIRYKCECFGVGSFEIAKIDKSEEYNLKMDGVELTAPEAYLFNGNLNDGIEEMSESMAYNLIINN